MPFNNHATHSKNKTKTPNSNKKATRKLAQEILK